MTNTVAEDEKHRLTAVQGLAALSLDALSSVAYGPEAVGILLIPRAFASGCSALTGVEAIANAVPEFRKPRARRAQHTEVWLGILLGAMLIGLGILIRKFHVVPQATTTVLAQLTEASLGHNFAFYAVQLITTVLLALAANTSFGGLPVLTAFLARDNFLPHMFALRADRQVHRYGVIVLAILAAALLVAADGNTQALVPLFAVGVFIGFTLSQLGMVKHWHTQRTPGWRTRAAINGFGALLTALTTVIELVSKFTEGAWLIAIVIPGLVLMFGRIHATYTRIGGLLGLGHTPEPPTKHKSLVVVLARPRPPRRPRPPPLRRPGHETLRLASSVTLKGLGFHRDLWSRCRFAVRRPGPLIASTACPAAGFVVGRA